jgi:hypothetical protein
MHRWAIAAALGAALVCGASCVEWETFSYVPFNDAAGQGGEGGAACVGATDCPGEDGFCGKRTCTDGRCGTQVEAAGMAVPSQRYGDCKRVICDGRGHAVVELDPSDVYDDGNPCTVDTCLGGAPQNQPAPALASCPDGVCDAAGRCAACADDFQCSNGQSCQLGRCVPASCTNGVLDGADEVDLDCGGAHCNPCADGARCTSAGDCRSGVCFTSSGDPDKKTCQAPLCGDGAKNGSETDVDCGGSCGPCKVGGGCRVGVDCAALVCVAGICAAPSCSDAVRNGAETGVDCGGACAACAGD